MSEALLYLLYAFGQAVVIQQGFIRDRAAPGLLVLAMAIAAPLVTVAAVILLLCTLLSFLSTPWGRDG